MITDGRIFIFPTERTNGLIRTFLKRLSLALTLLAAASLTVLTLQMPSATAEPAPDPSPKPTASDSALAQALALNDPAKQEGIPTTKKWNPASPAPSCDELKPGSPKLAQVPPGKNALCIASQGPASKMSLHLAPLPRPAEIPAWCQDATYWEFNRTEACRHWVYNVLLVDDRGQVRGTIELDTWDKVNTTPNAERMIWEQWLNPQFQTGGPWTGLAWTTTGDCSGQCALQTQNVTIPVDFGSKWTRAYHWFVSTLGSKIGERTNISLDVEHRWDVPGTLNLSSFDHVVLDEEIRCDYREPGTNAYNGCVIPSFVPTMRVPRSTMPEFANHVADAQATNWPEGAPGNVPLTRLTDQGDIEENRKQSCANAPSPRPQGKECDEYPFASTWQGSYTSGFPASWRLISKADNKAGGDLLLAVYNQNRILNNDPFYVQVVTI